MKSLNFPADMMEIGRLKNETAPPRVVIFKEAAQVKSDDETKGPCQAVDSQTAEGMVPALPYHQILLGT